jgi:membrane protein
MCAVTVRRRRFRRAAPPAVARRPHSFVRRTGRILLRTARAFIEDNVSRLGAALAFYTTIAVAPLLVLTIAVAGIFFEESAAREKVIGEIEALAGRQAGAAVAAVQSPATSSQGSWATALGLVTLLFGAFGVFYHLQDALNSIWRVRPEPTVGWRAIVRQRLCSLATVFATGFLLLVSLIASAALSWIGSQAVLRFGLPVLALQIVNNGLSFAVITFLFAVMFRLLPDTHVPWRHVWLGAVATALLFTIGKSALGLYLARATVTSAYGAAGSVVVLLLWCYYAGQIVFLGAEFTRVTALSDGGRDFAPLETDAPRTADAPVPAQGDSR